MSQLFYHTALRDRTSFTGDPEKLPYIKTAIHMHKVPTPNTMHNLHAYYLHSQRVLREKCEKTGDVHHRAEDGAEAEKINQK